MAEQERISKRKQRQRNVQRTEGAALPLANGSRYGEAEKKLSEVDAAFDDFLAGTSRAAADSIVVGQQRPQQVVKPLSNEEFVRGFQQTSGQ